MKKDEVLYVKVDSRNRVTIPKKLAKHIAHLYKVYEKDGAIVLEAVHEASKEAQWLSDPKNKAILERLKEEARQEEHKPHPQHAQHGQNTQSHNNQQRNQNNQNQQNNQHNPINNNGSHNDRE